MTKCRNNFFPNKVFYLSKGRKRFPKATLCFVSSAVRASLKTLVYSAEWPLIGSAILRSATPVATVCLKLTSQCVWSWNYLLASTSVLRWLDRDNVLAKFLRHWCYLLKCYFGAVKGSPHVQSPICITLYVLLPTSAIVGTDKSLARPGRKQATFPAFYGTWEDRYHIHKSPPPVPYLLHGAESFLRS